MKRSETNTFAIASSSNSDQEQKNEIGNVTDMLDVNPTAQILNQKLKGMVIYFRVKNELRYKPKTKMYQLNINTQDKV